MEGEKIGEMERKKGRRECKDRYRKRGRRL